MAQQRDVVLILGTTGSGKTTITRQLRTKARRSITLDPMAEYTAGTVFNSFSDLYDWLEVNQYWNAGSFQAICRFRSDLDNEYVFKLISDDGMRDVLLVIEEAEMYLNPRSMNEDFLWLIRYGRHNNISLLCVARRVPEITIDFRAMTTAIISFRQIEPNDLKYLEGYGIAPDEVMNLPEHQFIIKGVKHTLDEIRFEQ